METLNEWLLNIQQQFYLISWLEFIGVLFGITQVLFAKYNKVWLYPCGIISILITAYIYFDVRLYAEILLQGYYFIMSIYGWVLWTRKGGNEQKISLSTVNDRIISILIVVVSWSLLYFLLKNCTNSDVPIWDSLVSSFAWAGMWLLAKRKLDNWIFLNISNFVAVPLLIHKGLFLYSVLTVFLFIVAIFGYFDWKKMILFSEKRI